MTMKSVSAIFALLLGLSVSFAAHANPYETQLKNGLRVIVRFEGGPAWDSDRMVRVGTDSIPEADRNRWLYEITDPHKENLLNVQSDRIECRVLFNYEKGAFDPDATTAPDAWKETPWLRAFRIEYVAPASVVTTEDLR